MSTALEVALFAAAVAIVVSTAVLVPLALMTWQRLNRLAHIAEELRTALQVLMHDSRELMWSVNELSKRVTREMDDVDEMVCTVKQWAARTDRLVNAVGSIVEPPIFALASGARLARVGVKAFLQSLFHRSGVRKE